MKRRMKTDGCTGVPDIIAKCCELHDLRYRGYLKDVSSRREADRLFWDCIMDMARRDEWYWKPMWWFIAWIYWLGARVFGRKAWRSSNALFNVDKEKRV